MQRTNTHPIRIYLEESKAANEDIQKCSLNVRPLRMVSVAFSLLYLSMHSCNSMAIAEQHLDRRKAVHLSKD
jgi:hypothetical protein